MAASVRAPRWGRFIGHEVFHEARGGPGEKLDHALLTSSLRFPGIQRRLALPSGVVEVSIGDAFFGEINDLVECGPQDDSA